MMMKIVSDRIDERVRSFGSQAAWARALGVSPTYISLVRSGKKKPSDRLLADLGLRIENVFVEREAKK